jgi:hypothetical protein
MTDFGNICINGRKLPLLDQPKVTFVSEQTTETDLVIGGQPIFETEMTFRADRRQLTRFRLVLSGGHPHRSHRVTKRRKTRLDRERIRDMKRLRGSHLRWERTARFDEGIRQTRETREPVETVTPMGIPVVVRAH